MRASHATATALAASLLLTWSGLALAAQSESTGTSGPAAGTNVKPGTTQKMAHYHKKSSTKSTNTVGGAPGVPGAKGSKAGPAAK